MRPRLPSFLALFVCVRAVWVADVDDLGGVNLLQTQGLRASVARPNANKPKFNPKFDPITKLERETGLYCRFGGRLPWWRALDGDRPKMALSCSEKNSICEELSQAAQKSCVGVTIAEEECVMGIERDVSVGLLDHMSEEDAKNPCQPLMRSLGDNFEIMCWANERSCGAVMKVQEDPESGEVHCGATCKAAGMVCVSAYNDFRRNCGRYWEPKFKKSCESNVGHRGLCECSLPGKESAPLKGDSFYFYGHKLLCEDFVTAGGGALLQVKTDAQSADLSQEVS